MKEDYVRRLGRNRVNKGEGTGSRAPLHLLIGTKVHSVLAQSRRRRVIPEESIGGA